MNSKLSDKFRKYTTVNATAPLVARIRNGAKKGAKQCNGQKCVVARALKQELDGRIDEVLVGTSVTYIRRGQVVTKYRTPYSLNPHIRAFDHHGFWNIPDGDYTFQVPNTAQKVGARKGVKARSGNPGAKRAKRHAPSRSIGRLGIK